MLNCITIAGKVVETPEMKETSNGVKYTNILVDCSRGFKNNEGVYESDIICVTLWRALAESSLPLCKKGSYVGMKGRLQSHPFTSEEGTTYYNYDIVAEKVSFLSKSEK